jgi:hypothetical protein
MSATATKTKSKGKKQPQAASAALFATNVQLAPPCAGQGPYPGGAWSTFPAVPDGRVAPCAGFWGYLRRFPSTGGIVAQLGAEPGTGSASCTLYAGYQYVFAPSVGGEHVITLTLNLGPVTRRPRYGKVQIAGVLQIMGPGGHWADFYEDLPSNTAVTLCIRPRIQAYQKYTLRFGVAPIIQNAGQQSYGEAILNSAVLTQHLPYGVQAAGFQATKSDGLLKALFDANNQQDAKEVSLEDAAAMGVGINV